MTPAEYRADAIAVLSSFDADWSKHTLIIVARGDRSATEGAMRHRFVRTPAGNIAYVGPNRTRSPEVRDDEVKVVVLLHETNAAYFGVPRPPLRAV